jgi:MFS transporter, DHA1 family, tetracycline resistance protein
MTTAAVPAAGKREPAMAFIMIVVLIDMISIGLIVPVLPALVGQFTQSPSEQAFWYAAVAFAFGLANFFGAPILGALSDRFGRRPVLLIGCFGLGLTLLATGLSTALWMLVAIRLIGGAMQGNAAVANAYVADITPPEERARRFGLLGAMFGIGFILGPVMGGLLGAIDLRLPFFVAGALCLVNLAYGYFVLPESLPADRRRPFSSKACNPIASLMRVTQLKGVGLLIGTVACVAIAQFTMYTIWVLYTTFKFGWGPSENGWSLFFVGVMSAIVQGWLLGKLLKRTTAQKLVVIGLVSSSIAYLLYGLAPAGWAIYVVTLLNVLGFTVAASLNSVVSGAADATRQGETMGAVSSLNSLMAAIAPLIGPPMLAAVSHLPQGDWRIGAPFYFCAVLQAAAMVLAWRHFKRHPGAARTADGLPPATPAT